MDTSSGRCMCLWEFGCLISSDTRGTKRCQENLLRTSTTTIIAVPSDMSCIMHPTRIILYFSFFRFTLLHIPFHLTSLSPLPSTNAKIFVIPNQTPIPSDNCAVNPHQPAQSAHSHPHSHSHIQTPHHYRSRSSTPPPASNDQQYHRNQHRPIHFPFPACELTTARRCRSIVIPLGMYSWLDITIGEVKEKQ